MQNDEASLAFKEVIYVSMMLIWGLHITKEQCHAQ